MEKETSLQQYVMPPLVVLIVNAIILIAIAMSLGAIFACKVLFIEIALALSLICAAIAFFHKIIFNELLHLEILAQEGQEEATVILTHGRSALHQLRMKMDETVHPHEDNTMNELISNMVPMVQLFVNKEKNMLRWGMFGWKVANNAFRLFNQRTKSS